MKKQQQEASLLDQAETLPAVLVTNTPLHRIEMGIVAGLLALFLLLSFTSMRRKNATFDEGVHIPAGYTYVAYGDFRLNPEHPPLSKWLAGLAQRFLAPTVVVTDAAWEKGEQWEFGAKYLYAWNDAERLIFAARTPGVFLAALLGLVLFFAARSLYGWQAGCLALVLWVLNPDVLAHAQLVTTDLPVAGFLFLAVYCFFRALQRTTVVNVLLLGLAVGGCLVAKFSGVLIFPMLLLVGAAFVFSQQQGQLLLRGKDSLFVSRKEKAVLALGLIVAAGVMSVAVIWASYGFHARLSPEAVVANRIDWQHHWVKEKFTTTVLRLPQSLHLLPEAYLYGFLVMLESAENRLSYLLGETSGTGWWYYFLVTFFVKTPIPLLLLIGLGLVFLRKYGAGLLAEAMLLAPAGLYLLIALTANLNIGHRHLLPIYPFLIVCAAKVARAFSWPQPRRLTIFCGVLLAWHLIGTLVIYPHFLSYFNELVGGPKHGYTILADSNIDWGQDLKALAEYRRAHPEGTLYLSYFGTASPQYYGLEAEMLPGFSLPLSPQARNRQFVRFNQIPSGSLVAISVTNLTGLYLRMYNLPGTQEFLQRLQKMEPLARIGYSINIYRLE